MNGSIIHISFSLYSSRLFFLNLVYSCLALLLIFLGSIYEFFKAALHAGDFKILLKKIVILTTYKKLVWHHPLSNTLTQTAKDKLIQLFVLSSILQLGNSGNITAENEGRKDSEPVIVWLLVWQASSNDTCLKLVLMLSVEPSCWNERQKHGVWSTMLLWLSPLCQVFHEKYLRYSENVWDVRYSERLGRSSYKEQYAYYYRWVISGKGVFNDL